MVRRDRNHVPFDDQVTPDQDLIAKERQAVTSA
jgi:hypothetical protein